MIKTMSETDTTGMMDLPSDILLNIAKRFTRLSDFLSLRRTHPFFRQEFPRFIKEAERLTFYVHFPEYPDYEKYGVKIEMKKRMTEYGPRREMHIAGIFVKSNCSFCKKHAIIPLYTQSYDLDTTQQESTAYDKYDNDNDLEALTDLLMVDDVILVDSSNGLATTSVSFKTGFQKDDKSVIIGCIRYFLQERISCKHFTKNDNAVLEYLS